ncbi:MAG: porin family protein [Candidatus Thiodiazotropha sp. (ex Monitilora ramsayi)]|nr:porin family protein [Candidatus Thiodiazotropha sp. (ex Monitilora ramsayi)]
MLKNKKSILSLALASLVCLSGTLTADEAVDRSKWYAGIGLGLSRLEPDRNGSIYSVDDKSSTGFKLYVGYDWSEKISIEGYFSDLGEAKMAPFGEVSYKDIGASGLYYFYRENEERHRGWEGFLKAGLGWMKNDTQLPYERVHNSHVMFGLGGGYTFDSGITVRADLDLYDEDSQFLIFSLAKRFGE